MKDLMEMSYKIHETVQGDLHRQKAFVEQFLQELAKEESADIAPHFTCMFDVVKQEYVVTLKIPAAIDKFHSGGSDQEEEEPEGGVATEQSQNSKTHWPLTDDEQMKCAVKWLNALYKAFADDELLENSPCGECRHFPNDCGEIIPPPANFKVLEQFTGEGTVISPLTDQRTNPL